MKHQIKNRMSVLEALKIHYPDSSVRTLRSWINHGRVLIDGVPVVRDHTPVLPGQELSIEKKREVGERGVVILFEDKEIIVVDKPAKLLSVATDFQKENTLHALLKRRPPYGKIYPVHRLDRDTSGVLVFAKTERARTEMRTQFEARTTERIYLALVEGILQDDQGTWKSHLIEDAQMNMRSTDKGGKVAITHFKVIKRSEERTLLELKLETGRKNQIRVHCQEAGHPVVGDKKYGATTNPYKRLCLHAHTLAFDHPVTKRRLHFTSTLTPQVLST